MTKGYVLHGVAIAFGSGATCVRHNAPRRLSRQSFLRFCRLWQEMTMATNHMLQCSGTLEIRPCSGFANIELMTYPSRF